MESETMGLWSYIGYGALGLFLLVLIGNLFSSFVIVEQKTKRVVQWMGSFSRVMAPGLRFKWGWLESVSVPVSLRVQQLDLQELTYTKQGTSVTIHASVQYQVDESDASVKNAYYELMDPQAQIQSHVSSAIRSKVPTMSLEQVQENQREIANFVKEELSHTMQKYGYVISDVLITKADPDSQVVQANNEKYASEQAKVTAQNLADANAIKVIRNAEAEKMAMKAHGEGIAAERQAIAEGLSQSVESLQKAVHGSTAREAMSLVTYQQYMDTLTKLGQSGQVKVIFVNNSATAPSETMQQLQATLMSAAEAGNTPALEQRQQGS